MTVLLLGLGYGLSAQNEALIDSLKRVVAGREAGDSLRFDALGNLWHTTLYSDLSGSRAYARQLLEEARAKGTMRDLALGHRLLGISYDYAGREDSAAYHYRRGIVLYRRLNNRLQEGVLLYNSAILHKDAGRYDSARVYLEMADTALSGTGYAANRTAVKLLSATMERELGRPHRAIDYAIEAYTAARDAGLEARAADAEQEIAFIHQELGDQSAAAEYFERSLSTYRALNDHYFATVSLINLANAQLAMGKIDEALAHSQTAREWVATHGMADLEVEVLPTYAEAEMMKGNPEAAERSLLEVLGSLQDESRAKDRGHVLSALSKAELQLGKLAGAERHAREALVVAREQGRLEDVYDILGTVAEVSSRRGDYAAATVSLRERQAVRDSIYRADLADRMAELTVAFERERQDHVIREQQGRLALLESRGRAERLQNTLLIGGLLLLPVLLLLTWYTFRQRSRRLAAESELLTEQVASQELALSLQALEVAQKSETLGLIQQDLSRIRGESSSDRKQLDRLLRALQSEDRVEQDWDNFRTYFTGVHGAFEERLRNQARGKLSGREIRLATLVRMRLNNQEIGSILKISQASLYKAKYRLRKKLPADAGELDEFLWAL